MKDGLKNERNIEFFCLRNIFDTTNLYDYDSLTCANEILEGRRWVEINL